MTRALQARGVTMEDAGDLLGSLSNLGLSFGAALGPLLGGIIVQHSGGPVLGFQRLTTALAICTACAAVATTLPFRKVARGRAQEDGRGAPLLAPLVDPTNALVAHAPGRIDGGE